MREIRAFKEDMAPQMILLMGLPAAGKTTFVKQSLAKYYNHRMPHIGGFKVINSDVQLRRFQYERCVKDYNTLKQIDSEDEWAKQTASMSYRSNDGLMIDFVLTHDEFLEMENAGAMFAKMYKPYYATYFGERASAKKSTDELADRKIGKGDVVILDSTGVNTAKMLSYFKTGHQMGYTTSVVYLDIDVELTIARDHYRGETEGRSVGERTIRAYVPRISAAWKTYLAENDLVDRLLRFRWHGGVKVKEGTYKLVRDFKRYPRKEERQKMAASTETVAKPVGKGQQLIVDYLKREGTAELTEMTREPAFRGQHFAGLMKAAEALEKKGMIKREGRKLSLASLRLSGKQQAEVVATLLKAGRRDLAKQLIVTASGHHHKEGKDYYADTAFMNSIPREAGTLKHMGFGEFTLVQRDGTEIEFDRMRGKDFPGQSGRSHQLYDNKGGKGVAALIKLMEQKKASELV